MLLEFIRDCEDISWNHDKPTPGRSETNRIAVNDVKEGTSALLFQSGLSEKWWGEAVECFCYLRNIHGELADRKSPYERRFGTPFGGPVMPFGPDLFETIQSPRKTKSRLSSQFWDKDASRNIHRIRSQIHILHFTLVL